MPITKLREDSFKPLKGGVIHLLLLFNSDIVLDPISKIDEEIYCQTYIGFLTNLLMNDLPNIGKEMLCMEFMLKHHSKKNSDIHYSCTLICLSFIVVSNIVEQGLNPFFLLTNTWEKCKQSRWPNMPACTHI